MAKKNKKKIRSLISKEFFPESLDIDTSKVYPMLVMATMSSGKSTLINALLGQQILPSMNAACTAKMYSILDMDDELSTKLYITDINNNVRIVKEDIQKELIGANEDDNVAQIFIKRDVKGVLNTDKELMIVDTPGPNNARDLSHGEIMYDILNKVSGGLILYLINATQLGINDDKGALHNLLLHKNKHNQLKVIFVLNKVDQIDVETESLEDIVACTRDYLSTNGFDNPNIIPVSALAAGLFKKVLEGDELTRREYRAFIDLYDLYGPKDFNLKSYAITDDLSGQYKKIIIKNNTYKVSDLLRAVENTGIKLLEEIIQREQILSSTQKTR
ncbi:MAG: dynamin family protein [Lachnospiraceae bacterium]